MKNFFMVLGLMLIISPLVGQAQVLYSKDYDKLDPGLYFIKASLYGKLFNASNYLIMENQNDRCANAIELYTTAEFVDYFSKSPLVSTYKMFRDEEYVSIATIHMISSVLAKMCRDGALPMKDAESSREELLSEIAKIH